MRDTNGRSYGRYAAGFGLSLAATILTNSLLVVCKETSPAIKSWMKAVTGHHWLTHAAILMSAYVLLGLVLSAVKPTREIPAGKLLLFAVVSVALGCGTILGYYLVHALLAGRA